MGALRSCLRIISTYQDATRYPPPATRKGPTVRAFAGSGQRAAGSVFLASFVVPVFSGPFATPSLRRDNGWLELFFYRGRRKKPAVS